MHLLVSSEFQFAKSVIYCHTTFLRINIYLLVISNLDLCCGQYCISAPCVITDFKGVFHMHPGSHMDVLHMPALCKSNAKN